MTIYAKSLFLEHGFTITDTDDGCRAWYKTVTGSNGTFHALVTDNAGDELPDYGDIVAQIYRDDGAGTWEGESLFEDSSEYAADCLAELIPSLNYYVGIES